MEATKGQAVGAWGIDASQFVSITIAETDECFSTLKSESVLEGMRRLGKRGIPLGCRSGGCSVCKIQVLSGEYFQYRPMSAEYISKEDLENSCVLACCIKPLSDLKVKVIGKMHKNVCAK